MTNAKIELPNGTKISVEGTPEEVAKTVKLMQSESGKYSADDVQSASRPKKLRQSKKIGAKDRVRELICDGFFKEQKNLPEVKHGLAAKGHIYPLTTLSPAMVRLVRGNELRRLKHNKKWTYVEV